MKFNTLLISAALLVVPAHSLAASETSTSLIKKAGIAAATGAGLYGCMKLYSNYSSNASVEDSLVKGTDTTKKEDKKGVEKIASKATSILSSQKAKHLAIGAAHSAVAISALWQTASAYRSVKDWAKDRANTKRPILFNTKCFWTGQLAFPTAVAAYCFKSAYDSVKKAFETPVSNVEATVVVEKTK